jgi:hypothetical protein
MFSRQVQERIQATHSDLYHPSGRGWPTVAIRNGVLLLQSINAAPFGVVPLLDVDQFSPLESRQISPTK